ncbi:MAG TPA: TonB-dependent receptor [Steroidobacteraceae bacterium]|nr:TonB-dependent receptor [Steroidobacteraceae bacterium]
MKHTFAGALAGLLLLAVMNGSHAQSGPSGNGPAANAADQTGSDDQLQEVVVTARSLETEIPQQLTQYGTREDTVSAAQILTGGYIDVSEALEAQTPGLYVSSDAGPFNYVHASLQGSRTEDILWLVDDIRINNRLYGSTTPLDTIPASMIERIEVLDGAQALFYGTQAVAGAVNIVTKDFTNHPGGAFSLGADSNNGKHLDGYFRDALDSNYFVLYGTHDESSGIQPYLGSDYQPSATDRRRGYNETTLGAKYGYNFTNDLAFSALYQHTDARVDDLEQPTTVAEDFNQRNEDLVSAKLDYVPSDELKVYAKGYYHRWSSHNTEINNGSSPYYYTYVPGTPGELTVDDEDAFWGYRDYGANLMAQAAIVRGLEVVGGYDLQSYIGRDAVLVIQQETETVNAVFAQLRTTPALVSGLHLAAGVRYDSASFGPSATVWNGGAEYDFLPSLYLKANVGTAFRLPTDEELFANDPDDERGDPSLKPETSHNANVAIGGSIPVGTAAGPLHWEAMTFYRNIANLIDYQSYDDTTGQYVFGNVPGAVRTLGEQLTLDMPIASWLSAALNSTYNHARQSGVDYQFDQIPVTLSKANVDYHPAGSHFGADLTIERIGDLDDEPFGPGAGRVGYGDYTIVDIGGRFFLDAARHQRIDVHIDNIFNRIYFSGVGSAQTDADQTSYVVHDLALPRTFQANYTYSF